MRNYKKCIGQFKLLQITAD